jgi:hypothetical protein
MAGPIIDSRTHPLVHGSQQIQRAILYDNAAQLLAG